MSVHTVAKDNTHNKDEVMISDIENQRLLIGHWWGP